MEHRFFDPQTGIYRGINWPSVELPQQPELDLVTFLLSSTNAGKAQYASKRLFIDGDTDESLTYADVHDKLKRIASGLISLGVKKGDVVALVLSNTIYYPVIFLAITSLGAICATMNPLSSVSELGSQIQLSGAKFAFVVANILEKVKNFGMELIVHGDFNDEVHGMKFTPFSSMLAGDGKNLPNSGVILQSDPALLMFSSGTTGLSKGVVITHRNAIALMAHFVTLCEELRDRSHNQTPPDQIVSLIPIPLFHVFGLAMTIAVLVMATQTVIMNKFDLVKMLELIQKYRATDIPAVPPMVVAMAKQPFVLNYDLSSLRTVGTGGAPMPVAIVEAFKTRFPNVSMAQGYGMTESTGPVSSTLDSNHPVGSVGYLAINIQGRIADVSTSQPLPPNEEGELLLRGPQVMAGYLNDSESTATIIDEEGWLHTGDLAYFDLKGNLFIVDRIKELIKYKAYQVAPAELEKVLLKHPEIADAAVVPIPDEEAGQLPVAWVVRTSNSLLTDSDVMTFVANEVAPYKKIRRVLFVDTILKGQTGKALRRQLSDEAAKVLLQGRV